MVKVIQASRNSTDVMHEPRKKIYRNTGRTNYQRHKHAMELRSMKNQKKTYRLIAPGYMNLPQFTHCFNRSFPQTKFNKVVKKFGSLVIDGQNFLCLEIENFKLDNMTTYCKLHII